jgi:hypothetical protein
MNRLTGFDAFLARWRERAAGSAEESRMVRQSELGNRNVRGSAVDTEAYSYVPTEAAFEGSLEPGIRELVLFLVNGLGVVTYSSCEGHRSSDVSPLRAAHVGVLTGLEGSVARAARDGEAVPDPIVGLLDYAAVRSMSELVEPWVGVRVLEDHLDTDVGPRSSVDVWFLPIRGTELDYFRELPALLLAFQRTLEKIRAELCESGTGEGTLVYPACAGGV